jgi:hypothetical protein
MSGVTEAPTLAPDSTPAKRRHLRSGGFHRDRRRIVLVPCALGIAASLAALGIVFIGGPGTSIPTASAALSEAASNTPGHSPVPGASQYLVLHESFQIRGVQVESNGKSFNFDIPGTGEWWIPQSGEGED